MPGDRELVGIEVGFTDRDSLMLVDEGYEATAR